MTSQHTDSSRTLPILIAGVAAAFAIACNSPQPQNGTNTNWFQACSTSTDCTSGGSCLCGVCTKTCSVAADCSALSESRCVSAAGAPASCGLSNGACLLECTKDADCATSKNGARCLQNSCVRPTLPDPQCTSSDGGCSDGSAPTREGGSPDVSTDTAKPYEASTPFDVKPPGPGAGGALGGVAATDTGWIAVGSLPALPFAITAAQDGLAWHPISVPGAGSMEDVAFGNGITVAVARPSLSSIPSQIFTLPPNGSWQRQQPTNVLAVNVVFGNGKFFVRGHSTVSGVSSNGVDWTESINTQWTRFVDGQFVAYVQKTPFAEGGFRTSTDGLTWSDAVVPIAAIGEMGFLDVIGGNLAGIAGLPWCDSGACAFREFIWLSGNTGTAPSDLSGIRVKLPLPSSNADSGYGPYDAHPPQAVASNGSRIAAISDKGAIWTAPIPAFPPPPEGPAWIIPSLPENWVMTDIAYAFGKFVAVGRMNKNQIDSDAVIAVSEDGLIWQSAEIRN